MYNTSNKKVLLLGSSGGIGKSIYNELIQHNYIVISPSHKECDLEDFNSIDLFLRKYHYEFDIFINAAGINIHQNINDEFDTKLFERMLYINSYSTLYIVNKILPYMKSNNYGNILAFSSIWGQKSCTNRFLYSFNKFGIRGAFGAIAHDVGKYNVLINCIAPGFVNTEMTKQNISDERKQKLITDIPLGRFAEPNEIAKLVMFLVSDLNTYITGTTINIDGGFLA